MTQDAVVTKVFPNGMAEVVVCLLYTSDAADD